MTTPQQPGWYDDPHDSNAQRYWDGQDWTPHRQRKPISRSTPAPAPRPTLPPPPVTPTLPPPPSLPPPPDQQPQWPPPGQPPGGGPPQNMPDSNLVWAVLSTFLCCLPLGVVAIINASKVSGLWAQGQYAEAQAAADSAKKFAIWSAIAQAVLVVVIFFIMVVLPLIGLSLLGTTTTSPQ
jgi:uncharacterized integral membrane protein